MIKHYMLSTSSLKVLMNKIYLIKNSFYLNIYKVFYVKLRRIQKAEFLLIQIQIQNLIKVMLKLQENKINYHKFKSNNQMTHY